MTLDRAVIVECLGWAATAVFVASYFCARAEVLVRVQILGALAWVAYGVLTRAAPVVGANLLVVAAAAWKALRARRGTASGSAKTAKGEPDAGQMTVPSGMAAPLGTTTMPSRM